MKKRKPTDAPLPLLNQPGPGQKLSDNPLFKGEVVTAPLKCTQKLLDVDGDNLYKCPHCGNWATSDDCDSGGAEKDCLFCNECNGEFEM